MNSKLRITALQIPLFWEDADKNRDYIENHLNVIDKDTDIILLPEMFTTGFTMNAKQVAESMEGASVIWMKSWAKKLEVLLGGSLVIKEDGKFYNRFVMVDFKGIVTYYDKRHTFTLAGEDKIYESGTNSGLFEYQGWKICLRICYDLRFPVWSRNTKDYDLLLFVANWPMHRINAWDTLLKARAIENICYVVGVNRIGTDGEDINYSGHSAIFDPLGNSLASNSYLKDIAIKAELNYKELQLLRKKLPFLDDRDSFEIY